MYDIPCSPSRAVASASSEVLQYAHHGNLEVIFGWRYLVTALKSSQLVRTLAGCGLLEWCTCCELLLDLKHEHY